MRLCLFAVLLAFTATAQQPAHKLVIDAGTPEGELLQRIAAQTTDDGKLALMEEFVARFPKHDAINWVAGQLQPLYIKQGNFDSALQLGEKALAADPLDLDAAYNNIKAAEGKKDADLITKWALQTSQMARQAAERAASPERAKQVDTYCEYSLYAAALTSAEPQKTVGLVEALEKLNPQSQYLAKVDTKYLNALRQSGQVDKAGGLAEKLAEPADASAEALLLSADYELQKKSQPEKVLSYSSRLIEVLNTRPKPDGLADAEWVKKKAAMLALANWMRGVVYSAQTKWLDADKSLRSGLPDLQDQQVRASCLYYLGLVDYQIAKMGRDKAWMQEALRFSEQSAGMEGPLQVLAERNVRTIRGELSGK